MLGIVGAGWRRWIIIVVSVIGLLAVGGISSSIGRNTNYGDTNTVEMSVQDYYNRATRNAAKGDNDRAIADYSEVIRLNPEFINAYYLRGNTYAAKRDYDQAIADYSQIIQRQTDNVEAYSKRGEAYAQKGEKDKAIADFQKVLEISKDDYIRKQTEERLKALEK